MHHYTDIKPAVVNEIEIGQAYTETTSNNDSSEAYRKKTINSLTLKMGPWVLWKLEWAGNQFVFLGMLS